MNLRLNTDSVYLFVLFVFGIYSSLVYSDKIEPSLNNMFMLFQLICIVFAVYFKNKNFQLRAILAMSFIGLDYVLMILPFILLPKIIFGNKKTNFKILKSPNFVAMALLLYSFLLIIPSSIADFSLSSNLFWVLTFGNGFIVYLYYSKFKYDQSEIISIIRFFEKLIFIQLVLLPFQGIINLDFQPGDWARGTFQDAHKTGFYILLLFISLFTMPLFAKEIPLKRLFRFKNMIYIFFLIYVLLLTDAKIIYLCFFFAICLFFGFMLFGKLRGKIKSVSLSKVTVLAIISLGMISIVPSMVEAYNKTVFNRSHSIVQYMEEQGKVSYKMLFYKRVFVNMLEDNALAWVFGVGPGKLGSRASNTLAYDVLYKEDQKIPAFIKPHSSPWVVKYMSDLWSEDIALKMRFTSSTLVSPFAGIASIKGELGIIGLLMFLILSFLFSHQLIIKANMIGSSHIRSWAFTLAIFWMAIPVLSIFDNFMEKPQIILPMFLLSVIILYYTVSQPQEQRSVTP